MDDGRKYRDFGWWLRLAAIAGVISFAVFFLVSYDGLLRSFRIVAIAIESLVGALVVVGVVAAVGHFVSRPPSPGGRNGRN